MAKSTTSTLGQFYISPSSLSKIYNANSRVFHRHFQRSDYESISADGMNQTIFIYITIEGVGDVNNFTLKFNPGNTLVKETSGSNLVVVNKIMLFLFIVLLVK